MPSRPRAAPSARAAMAVHGRRSADVRQSSAASSARSHGERAVHAAQRTRPGRRTLSARRPTGTRPHAFVCSLPTWAGAPPQDVSKPRTCDWRGQPTMPRGRVTSGHMPSKASCPRKEAEGATAVPDLPLRAHTCPAESRPARKATEQNDPARTPRHRRRGKRTATSRAGIASRKEETGWTARAGPRNGHGRVSLSSLARPTRPSAWKHGNHTCAGNHPQGVTSTRSLCAQSPPAGSCAPSRELRCSQTRQQNRAAPHAHPASCSSAVHRSAAGRTGPAQQIRTLVCI